MKIAIIAANGKAGKLIAAEAVNRGIDVTAFVRGENKSAAQSAVQKDALSRKLDRLVYVNEAAAPAADGVATAAALAAAVVFLPYRRRREEKGFLISQRIPFHFIPFLSQTDESGPEASVLYCKTKTGVIECINKM